MVKWSLLLFCLFLRSASADPCTFTNQTITTALINTLSTSTIDSLSSALDTQLSTYAINLLGAVVPLVGAGSCRSLSGSTASPCATIYASSFEAVGIPTPPALQSCCSVLDACYKSAGTTKLTCDKSYAQCLSNFQVEEYCEANDVATPTSSCASYFKRVMVLSLGKVQSALACSSPELGVEYKKLLGVVKTLVSGADFPLNPSLPSGGTNTFTQTSWSCSTTEPLPAVQLNFQYQIPSIPILFDAKYWTQRYTELQTLGVEFSTIPTILLNVTVDVTLVLDLNTPASSSTTQFQITTQTRETTFLSTTTSTFDASAINRVYSFVPASSPTYIPSPQATITSTQSDRPVLQVTSSTEILAQSSSCSYAPATAVWAAPSSVDALKSSLVDVLNKAAQLPADFSTLGVTPDRTNATVDGILPGFSDLANLATLINGQSSLNFGTISTINSGASAYATIDLYYDNDQSIRFNIDLRSRVSSTSKIPSSLFQVVETNTSFTGNVSPQSLNGMIHAKVAVVFPYPNLNPSFELQKLNLAFYASAAANAGGNIVVDNTATSVQTPSVMHAIVSVSYDGGDSPISLPQYQIPTIGASFMQSLAGHMTIDSQSLNSYFTLQNSHVLVVKEKLFDNTPQSTVIFQARDETSSTARKLFSDVALASNTMATQSITNISLPDTLKPLSDSIFTNFVTESDQYFSFQSMHTSSIDESNVLAALSRTFPSIFQITSGTTFHVGGSTCSQTFNSSDWLPHIQIALGFQSSFSAASASPLFLLTTAVLDFVAPDPSPTSSLWNFVTRTRIPYGTFKSSRALTYNTPFYDSNGFTFYGYLDIGVSTSRSVTASTTLLSSLELSIKSSLFNSLTTRASDLPAELGLRGISGTFSANSASGIWTSTLQSRAQALFTFQFTPAQTVLTFNWNSFVELNVNTASDLTLAWSSGSLQLDSTRVGISAALSYGNSSFSYSPSASPTISPLSLTSQDSRMAADISIQNASVPSQFLTGTSTYTLFLDSDLSSSAAAVSVDVIISNEQATLITNALQKIGTASRSSAYLNNALPLFSSGYYVARSGTTCSSNNDCTIPETCDINFTKTCLDPAKIFTGRLNNLGDSKFLFPVSSLLSGLPNPSSNLALSDYLAQLKSVLDSNDVFGFRWSNTYAQSSVRGGYKSAATLVYINLDGTSTNSAVAPTPKWDQECGLTTPFKFFAPALPVLLTRSWNLQFLLSSTGNYVGFSNGDSPINLNIDSTFNMKFFAGSIPGKSLGSRVSLSMLGATSVSGITASPNSQLCQNCDVYKLTDFITSGSWNTLCLSSSSYSANILIQPDLKATSIAPGQFNLRKSPLCSDAAVSINPVSLTQVLDLSAVTPQVILDTVRDLSVVVAPFSDSSVLSLKIPFSLNKPVGRMAGVLQAYRDKVTNTIVVRQPVKARGAAALKIDSQSITDPSDPTLLVPSDCTITLQLEVSVPNGNGVTTQSVTFSYADLSALTNADGAAQKMNEVLNRMENIQVQQLLSISAQSGVITILTSVVTLSNGDLLNAVNSITLTITNSSTNEEFSTSCLGFTTGTVREFPFVPSFDTLDEFLPLVHSDTPSYEKNQDGYWELLWNVGLTSYPFPLYDGGNLDPDFATWVANNQSVVGAQLGVSIPPVSITSGYANFQVSSSMNFASKLGVRLGTPPGPLGFPITWQGLVSTIATNYSSSANDNSGANYTVNVFQRTDDLTLSSGQWVKTQNGTWTQVNAYFSSTSQDNVTATSTAQLNSKITLNLQCYMPDTSSAPIETDLTIQPGVWPDTVIAAISAYNQVAGNRPLNYSVVSQNIDSTFLDAVFGITVVISSTGCAQFGATSSTQPNDVSVKLGLQTAQTYEPILRDTIITGNYQAVASKFAGVVFVWQFNEFVRSDDIFGGAASTALSASTSGSYTWKFVDPSLATNTIKYTDVQASFVSAPQTYVDITINQKSTLNIQNLALIESQWPADRDPSALLKTLVGTQNLVVHVNNNNPNVPDSTSSSLWTLDYGNDDDLTALLGVTQQVAEDLVLDATRLLSSVEAYPPSYPNGTTCYDLYNSTDSTTDPDCLVRGYYSTGAANVPFLQNILPFTGTTLESIFEFSSAILDDVQVVTDPTSSTGAPTSIQQLELAFENVFASGAQSLLNPTKVSTDYFGNSDITFFFDFVNSGPNKRHRLTFSLKAHSNFSTSASLNVPIAQLGQLTIPPLNLSDGDPKQIIPTTIVDALGGTQIPHAGWWNVGLSVLRDLDSNLNFICDESFVTSQLQISKFGDYTTGPAASPTVYFGYIRTELESLAIRMGDQNAIANPSQISIRYISPSVVGNTLTSSTGSMCYDLSAPNTILFGADSFNSSIAGKTDLLIVMVPENENGGPGKASLSLKLSVADISQYFANASGSVVLDDSPTKKRGATTSLSGAVAGAQGKLQSPIFRSILMDPNALWKNLQGALNSINAAFAKAQQFVKVPLIGKALGKSLTQSNQFINKILEPLVSKVKGVTESLTSSLPTTSLTTDFLREGLYELLHDELQFSVPLPVANWAVPDLSTWTVIASAQDSNNPASNVIDSDSNSYWRATGVDSDGNPSDGTHNEFNNSITNWIVIGLDKTRCFSKVQIDVPTAAGPAHTPVDVKVATSDSPTGTFDVVAQLTYQATPLQLSDSYCGTAWKIIISTRGGAVPMESWISSVRFWEDHEPKTFLRDSDGEPVDPSVPFVTTADDGSQVLAGGAQIKVTFKDAGGCDVTQSEANPWITWKNTVVDTKTKKTNGEQSDFATYFDGKGSEDVLRTCVNLTSLFSSPSVLVQQGCDALTKSIDAFDLDFSLGQDYILGSFSPAFSLGVDDFPLSVGLNGTIQVQIGWTLKLGFGVSKTSGFYLVPRSGDGDNLILVTASVAGSPTDPISGKGQLFFLNLNMLDNSAPGVQSDPDQHLYTQPFNDQEFATGLFGQIFMNMGDPNDDGRVTLTELRSKSSKTTKTPLAPKCKSSASGGVELLPTDLINTCQSKDPVNVNAKQCKTDSDCSILEAIGCVLCRVLDINAPGGWRLPSGNENGGCFKNDSAETDIPSLNIVYDPYKKSATFNASGLPSTPNSFTLFLLRDSTVVSQKYLASKTSAASRAQLLDSAGKPTTAYFNYISLSTSSKGATVDVTKAETIVQVKSKVSYNVSANELESTLCRGQAFVFVKINDKYWAAKVQLPNCVPPKDASVFGWGYAFSAGVNLNLHLYLDTGLPLPEFYTNLKVKYYLQRAQPTEFIVRFDDLALDFGAVARFLQPLAQKVKDRLSPVMDVIKVLETRIPVISDLTGREISLLTVADFVAPLVAGFKSPKIAEILKWVRVIKKVISLVETLEEFVSMVAGGTVPAEATIIRLPSIQLKPSMEIIPVQKRFTLEEVHTLTYFAHTARRTRVSGLLHSHRLIESIRFQESIAFFGDVSQKDHTMKRALMSDSDAKKETCRKISNSKSRQICIDQLDDADAPIFVIPLLTDPVDTALNILTGKPADLFRFIPPPFQFDLSFRLQLSTPVPGLDAVFSLGFSITCKFAFGFDTYGINQAIASKDWTRVTDGFFIADDYFTGQPVPQISIGGNVGVGLALNLGIVRAGVVVGIQWRVDISLYDPTPKDLKLRLSDITSVLVCNNYNPLALFSYRFRVQLYVTIYVDVFALFGYITVYEQTFAIPGAEFDITITPGAPPELGGFDTGSGKLTVYSGSKSTSRCNKFGKCWRGSGNDQVTVHHVSGDAGSETVQITMAVPGCGTLVQEFTGVSTVIVDVGTGGDLQVFEYLGLLTVNNAGTLTLDYSGSDDSIDAIFYTLNSIAGLATQVVYTTVSNKITVKLTSYDDSVTVYGTGAPLEIYGGDGSDQYTIDCEAMNFVGTLASGNYDCSLITKSLTFTEVATDKGSNTLIVDGSKSLSKFSAGKLVASPTQDVISSILPSSNTIAFSNIHSLQVNLGTNDDLFIVDSTTAALRFLSVYGCAGVDTISLGNTNNVVNNIEVTTQLMFSGGFPPEAGEEVLSSPQDAFIIHDDGDNPTGNNPYIEEAVVTDLSLLGYGFATEVQYREFGFLNLFTGTSVSQLEIRTTHDFTTNIQTGKAVDVIYILAYSGTLAVNGGEDTDAFFVQAQTSSQSLLTLNITGGPGNDIVQICLAASGDSVINVQGDAASSDQLYLFGSNDVLVGDTLLFRSNFIASIDPVAIGYRKAFGVHDSIGTYQRIGSDKMQFIAVYGRNGDDKFIFDDTVDSVIQTFGSAGSDSFIFGQLFNSNLTGINPQTGRVYIPGGEADIPKTTHVTVGWVSDGCHGSDAIVAMGGDGNDNFVVNRNKCILNLHGDDGDDNFVVQAFALYDTSTYDQLSTSVTGGGGADSVQYAINAPVSIDGGAGFNSLTVIGTEYPDKFWVSQDGIFGAGLFITFSSIQKVVLDTKQGDDTVYIASTSPSVVTEIYTGLGSDTVEVAPVFDGYFRVTSNNAPYHSGIINHHVESADINYARVHVNGINALVADPEDVGVLVLENGWENIVFEDNSVGSNRASFSVVLSSQPTSTDIVLVKFTVPLPPTIGNGSEPQPQYVTLACAQPTGCYQEQPTIPAKTNDTLHTSIPTPVLFKDCPFVPFKVGDTPPSLRSDRFVTIVFDNKNWSTPVQIYMTAPNDHVDEGEQRVTLLISTIQANHPEYDAQGPNASRASYNSVPVPGVDVRIIDSTEIDFNFVMPFGDIILFEGEASVPFSGYLWPCQSPNYYANAQLILSGYDPNNIVVSLNGAALSPNVSFNLNTLPNRCHLDFTISAPHDGVVEGLHFAKVAMTIQGITNSEPLIRTLNARIADRDAPVVVVQESFGQTILIENSPAISASGLPFKDSYTVRLSSPPSANVSIVIITPVTPSSNGNPLEEVSKTQLSTVGRVTFTVDNWNIEQTVEVVALNDGIRDGCAVKLFAPREAIAAVIQGPLSVFGGPSSLLSAEANIVRLPGESDLTSYPDPNPAAPYMDVIEDNQFDTLIVNNFDSFYAQTETWVGYQANSKLYLRGLNMPTGIRYIGGIVNQEGIEYADFESVQVNSGSGDDNVYYCQSTPGVTTFINTENGNDFVWISQNDEHVYVDTGFLHDKVRVSAFSGCGVTPTPIGRLNVSAMVILNGGGPTPADESQLDLWDHNTAYSTLPKLDIHRHTVSMNLLGKPKDTLDVIQTITLYNYSSISTGTFALTLFSPIQKANVVIPAIAITPNVSAWDKTTNKFVTVDGAFYFGWQLQDAVYGKDTDRGCSWSGYPFSNSTLIGYCCGNLALSPFPNGTSAYIRRSPCAQSFLVTRIETSDNAVSFIIQLVGELRGAAGQELGTFSIDTTNLGQGFASVKVSGNAIEVENRVVGVNYYNMAEMNVVMGVQSEIVNIRGTSAKTHLSLGPGHESVYVSSDANVSSSASGEVPLPVPYLTGHLDYIYRDLKFYTGDGNTQLFLSDELTAFSKPRWTTTAKLGRVNISDPTAPSGVGNGDFEYLSGIAPGTIFWSPDFSQLGSLPASNPIYTYPGDFRRGVTIWGGQQGNTIEVTSSALRVPPPSREVTTLNTGAGDDAIKVRLIDKQDGFFVLNTESGNDNIDASASTLPLIIFGGLGQDSIIGGKAWDIIFGDQGRVQYDYDNFTVKYTKRAPTLVTFGDPSQEADILPNVAYPIAAYTIDCTHGDNDHIQSLDDLDFVFGGTGGDTIDTRGETNYFPDDAYVLGDCGQVLFDTPNQFLQPSLLQSTDCGTGGNDIINCGITTNFIIGGVAQDQVTTQQSATDYIIGDNGRVVFASTTDAVNPPRNRPLLMSSSLTDAFYDEQNSDDGNADSVGPCASYSGLDTITASNGQNVIIGGSASDTITTGVDHDFILADNGFVKFEINSTLASAVKHMEAVLYPGSYGDADIVHSGSDNSANDLDVVFGGEGADEINTYDANDAVVGDQGFIDFDIETSIWKTISTLNSSLGGSDIIDAGNSDNIVLGGFGSDSLSTAIGDSVIVGDNGIVSWNSVTNLLQTVNTTSCSIGVRDVISCQDGKNIVFGGADQDTITCGPGPDVIVGDNGYALYNDQNTHIITVLTYCYDIGDNDKIDGGDGNNLVFGGSAQDNITTGTGNDIILGDNGQAQYFDQDANAFKLHWVTTYTPCIGDADWISSGASDDIVFGGSLNDRIFGGTGDDTILGDHGALDTTRSPAQLFYSIDILDSNCPGEDYIEGGSGDDWIMGQQLKDTIYGNSAVDGENTNDETDHDDIWGGHNVRFGDDTGDVIHGNADADFILGDNGNINRTLIFTGSSIPFPHNRKWLLHPAHPLFPSVFDTPKRNDSFQRFDDLDYISGDDQIWGDSGDDIIHGQRGNDVIYGGDGNDELYGELGSDTIHGDAGHDVILGDVGQIIRILDERGVPLLNLKTNAWKQDIVLEEVGYLNPSYVPISSKVANPQLLSTLIPNSDLIFLSGAFNEYLKCNQSAPWETYLLFANLVQPYDDVLNGDDGDDTVFGQRGNDVITGGNDEDMLFGDWATSQNSYRTDIPFIYNTFRFLTRNDTVFVHDEFGNTVSSPILLRSEDFITPLSTVVHAPLGNIHPSILKQHFGTFSVGGFERPGFECSLKPFATIIPDIVRHGPVLPGNDNIDGGAGADLIVGDNFVTFTLLENLESLPDTLGLGINDALSRMASVQRQLEALSQDTALWEKSQATKSNTTYKNPTTVIVGRDRLNGSSGNDLICGDDLLLLGGHYTSAVFPRPQVTDRIVALYHMYRDIEWVFGDLEAALYETHQFVLKSLAQATATLPTHTLRLGEDEITGNEGSDLIIGDYGYIIDKGIYTDSNSVPIHGRVFMRNVTRVLLPIKDQRTAMIAQHVAQDLRASGPVDPIASRIPSNPTFEVWSSNDKIYATDDDDADAIAGDVGIFTAGIFSVNRTSAIPKVQQNYTDDLINYFGAPSLLKAYLGHDGYFVPYSQYGPSAPFDGFVYHANRAGWKTLVPDTRKHVDTIEGGPGDDVISSYLLSGMYAVVAEYPEVSPKAAHPLRALPSLYFSASQMYSGIYATTAGNLVDAGDGENYLVAYSYDNIVHTNSSNVTQIGPDSPIPDSLVNALEGCLFNSTTQNYLSTVYAPVVAYTLQLASSQPSLLLNMTILNHYVLSQTNTTLIGIDVAPWSLASLTGVQNFLGAAGFIIVLTVFVFVLVIVAYLAVIFLRKESPGLADIDAGIGETSTTSTGTGETSATSTTAQTGVQGVKPAKIPRGKDPEQIRYQKF